jgi:hypothetical protein
MDMEFDYRRVFRWSPSPRHVQCPRLLRVIYQKMRSLIAVENKEQCCGRVEIISTNYMDFCTTLFPNDEWAESSCIVLPRRMATSFEKVRPEWRDDSLGI